MADESKNSVKRFDELNSSDDNSIFHSTYKIIETIGRGRHSVVYHAVCLPGTRFKASQDVALKVLTGSSRNPLVNRDRMKREAVAMLSSRSKHVVRLYDFVSKDDLYYLAMEYAPHKDLNFQLEQNGGLFGSELVLQISAQVLKGLEVIHNAGIVHRDIKPENLLLSSDGLIKIADFGIASIPTEDLPIEETKRGVGTFDYLAPELLENGICDSSSDIYSLGVTLYNLLSGVNPFESESLSESLDLKLSGDIPRLSELVVDVPPKLEKIVMKAMAPNREDRFQSAEEFRKAILDARSRTSRMRAGTKKFLLMKNLQTMTESGELEEIESPDYLPAIYRVEDYQFDSENPEELVIPKSHLFLTGVLKTCIAACAGIIIGVGLSGRNSLLADSFSMLKSPAPKSAIVAGNKPSIQNQVASIYKGSFDGFFSDDVGLKFRMIGESERNLIIKFQMPGNPEAKVSLARLQNGEMVDLSVNGLDVELSLLESERGKFLKGQYLDRYTGRTGSWQIIS